MAYPYQQMQEKQQAAKAEPDLPAGDIVEQGPQHSANYPAMGQPYQGQPGLPVGQPYQGQPGLPGQPYQGQPASPMGQPYPQPNSPIMGQAYYPQNSSQTMAQSFQPQMATMAYPMQPEGVPYAQPYVQQTFGQAPPMYAQPQAAVPVLPASIQCVICTMMVAGPHYRCVGCKNNGRPGGYFLCPTCHSRQRVREKGLLDEVNQGLGDLTHNTTKSRPHEKWHTYERVDPVAAMPMPVYVVPAAAPGGLPQYVTMQALPVAPVLMQQNIQLILGCKDLQRQGFGFILPDPSISVSINGKEIAHTEEAKQICSATFQRTVEVSNAESKVTFTVYTSGQKHGVITTTMSEILKSPGQTWTKPFEDPKKGYRLQSGMVVVKWIPVQGSQPSVAVAQPYMGDFQGVPAPQYAQPPQYYGSPPTYQ